MVLWMFSLLSRNKLLLIEHFWFCFNGFVFLLYDYRSLFLFSSLLLWLFLLLFCHYHYHCYFFIFNAFNIHFFSFYHSILSFYISLYKWCGQILFKVGKKNTDTVSVFLMGTLDTFCLNFSSDDLFLKWQYYILP